MALPGPANERRAVRRLSVRVAAGRRLDQVAQALAVEPTSVGSTRRGDGVGQVRRGGVSSHLLQLDAVWSNGWARSPRPYWRGTSGAACPVGARSPRPELVCLLLVSLSASTHRPMCPLRNLPSHAVELVGVDGSPRLDAHQVKRHSGGASKPDAGAQGAPDAPEGFRPGRGVSSLARLGIKSVSRSGR